MHSGKSLATSPGPTANSLSASLIPAAIARTVATAVLMILVATSEKVGWCSRTGQDRLKAT